MSHYDEEQQVEELRKWWKENWPALLAGLVIGLGGIFGWEAWQSHQLTVAGTASRLYQDLGTALDADKADEAAAIVDKLGSEYANTPYASQAALAMARFRAEKNEWAPAAQRLDWVLEHSDDEGLKQLARLRKARVLWAQDQADAALALLNPDQAGSYAPLYQELRGDILLSKGERDAARTAYQLALDAGDNAVANREMLQRKLDDLSTGAQS